MKEDLSRRNFISKTAAGLAGMVVASRASSMSAASYQRVIGLDRIHPVQRLDCGGSA